MNNKKYLFLSCSVFCFMTMPAGIASAQDQFTSSMNFESSTVQYNWHTTPWSACADLCGDSTQSRVATCRDVDGNTVPNSNCDHTVPPLTVRDCRVADCEWECADPPHYHPPPPPPPPPRTGGGGGDGGDGGDGDGYDVDGDGRADYNTWSEARDHTDRYGGTAYSTSDRCTGACDGRTADTGDGGDGGDGDGGGKVLCTYFHRHGEMNADDYYAGFAYGMQHAHPATFRGYHFWAVPYARYLYNNPGSIAEKIMRPIVLRRAQEISYKMGLRDKPDYTGKAIRMVMEPICFMIGLFVKETDYRGLYTKTELKMFKDRYKQHRIAKQAMDVVQGYNRYIGNA